MQFVNSNKRSVPPKFLQFQTSEMDPSTENALSRAILHDQLQLSFTTANHVPNLQITPQLHHGNLAEALQLPIDEDPQTSKISYETLQSARQQSVNHLKSTWERIFSRYEDVDEDEDDVINLRSETIEVDRGNIRKLPKSEFGTMLDAVLVNADYWDDQFSSDSESDDSDSEPPKASQVIAVVPIKVELPGVFIKPEMPVVCDPTQPPVKHELDEPIQDSTLSSILPSITIPKPKTRLKPPLAKIGASFMAPHREESQLDNFSIHSSGINELDDQGAPQLNAQSWIGFDKEKRKKRSAVTELSMVMGQGFTRPLPQMPLPTPIANVLPNSMQATSPIEPLLDKSEAPEIVKPPKEPKKQSKPKEPLLDKSEDPEIVKPPKEPKKESKPKEPQPEEPQPKDPKDSRKRKRPAAPNPSANVPKTDQSKPKTQNTAPLKQVTAQVERWEDEDDPLCSYALTIPKKTFRPKNLPKFE
jgi:hypothetical protein